MKNILLILSLVLSLSCLAQTDSVSRKDQGLERTAEKVEDRIDKNAKALSLLMIAVPALGSVVVALFFYIQKLHAGTVKLTEKCTEAITKMSATNEKLAVSIEGSGEKISSAFSENKTTIAMALTDNRRAIDELKSFIMLKTQT